MDFIPSRPWNWLWLCRGGGVGGELGDQMPRVCNVSMTCCWLSAMVAALSLSLPLSLPQDILVFLYCLTSFFISCIFLSWSCSSTNVGTVSRRQHLFLVSSRISRLTPRRALIYTRTLADDMSGEDWGWGVALVSLLCCPGSGYLENKHVIHSSNQ